MKKILLSAGLLVLAGSANATQTYVYWADPKQTTFLSFNGQPNTGDKALTSLGFLSPQFDPPSPPATTTTVQNGDSFRQFTDGSVTNNDGTFGWNDQIPRDVGVGGQAHSFNPDRGDNATLFASSIANPNTARLSEVFGDFTGQNRFADQGGLEPLAYKNMSYILDGEDDKTGYSVDLLFGGGKKITADNDASTVELSVLERGGNSDFYVQGIKGYDSLGHAILTDKYKVKSQDSQVANHKVWGLDTLEIGEAQPVVGYGLSLDSSWGDVIGFRLGSDNLNDNLDPTNPNGAHTDSGPDFVGVGVTSAPIPEPAFYQMSALVALGGIGLLRRRKKG